MSSTASPTPGFFQRLARRAGLFVRSLRFRLTLWFVAILGVIMVVFCGFIYSYQARELHTAALGQLTLKARQLVAFYRIAGLQLAPDGTLMVPKLENDSPLLQPDEILVIVDPRGQVLYSAGAMDSVEAGKLAAYSFQHGLDADHPFSYAVAETAQTGSPFQKEYYIAMAPLFGNETNPSLLILGFPSDPGNQLERLLFTLLVSTVGTLVVAWLGGYWLADRAMRPVQAITRTAREIGETDLNRRLNLHAQNELGELADTFDQMLARLQAAFDRQRQFTADASHELRTPLTIIGLETDRALSAPRSAADYACALNVIHAENETMTRLVTDLLTLARMDAGQTVLKLEALDLSDIVVDVLERLAPIASGRGVALSSGELPELTIQGDRQYLSQMLTNLVENAIKYTAGSDKAVRVETGRQAVNAWVRVTDNGLGIEPQHLPHLFDRFYRVDEARQRQPEMPGSVPSGEARPGGSGLGLSIVQWIVHAHGGEVMVQSEVGKGSVFEVDLPLSD